MHRLTNRQRPLALGFAGPGWKRTRAILAGLAAMAALTASAQIVVPNISGGNIGIYDANTGATINSSLFSGFTTPFFTAAAANGDFYVVDQTAGTVGEY